MERWWNVPFVHCCKAPGTNWNSCPFVSQPSTWSFSIAINAYSLREVTSLGSQQKAQQNFLNEKVYLKVF